MILKTFFKEAVESLLAQTYHFRDYRVDGFVNKEIDNSISWILIMLW
jgi:hypothetical protein